MQGKALLTEPGPVLEGELGELPKQPEPCQGRLHIGFFAHIFSFPVYVIGSSETCVGTTFLPFSAIDMHPQELVWCMDLALNSTFGFRRRKK